MILKLLLEKGLIKESNVISFSSLLTSGELLNEAPISLFKSVGMSLFDLTVAELIYNNAKEKGLGNEVKILKMNPCNQRSFWIKY